MLKKILVFACAASCATSVTNANQAIAPLVSEQQVEQEQQELIKQGQELVRQLRQQGYTDEKIAQLLIDANDDLEISTSEKIYYMLLGAGGVLVLVGGGFTLYKYVIEPKLRQRAQQAEAARIAAAQAEEARLVPRRRVDWIFDPIARSLPEGLGRSVVNMVANQVEADLIEADLNGDGVTITRVSRQAGNMNEEEYRQAIEQFEGIM